MYHIKTNTNNIANLLATSKFHAIFSFCFYFSSIFIKHIYKYNFSIAFSLSLCLVATFHIYIHTTHTYILHAYIYYCFNIQFVFICHAFMKKFSAYREFIVYFQCQNQKCSFLYTPREIKHIQRINQLTFVTNLSSHGH